MSKNRRKFSKDFKAKVVLEALNEREPFEVLAKKYELTPTQIPTWKALALKNFVNVFSTDPSGTKKGWNGRADFVCTDRSVKG